MAGSDATLKLLLGAAAGFGGSGFLLHLAAGRWRLWRRVADTPTARVRSVAMGRAELKGLARPLRAPLPAPFTGSPCCWWRVSVEQEEIRRGKDGATRREWREIHRSVSDAPFNLDDHGDAIEVRPAGAEVEAPKLLEFTTGGLGGGWLRNIGRGDPGAPPLPGPQAGAWLTGAAGARRRLREWRVDDQRPLYVLGVVRGREGGGAFIGSGRDGEPFLVSTDDEAAILRRLRWTALGGVALALVLLLAGLGCVLALLH